MLYPNSYKTENPMPMRIIAGGISRRGLNNSTSIYQGNLVRAVVVSTKIAEVLQNAPKAKHASSAQVAKFWGPFSFCVGRE